jgi:predicted nucleic acid-binding protein
VQAYADSSFIVSLYLPEPERTDRAIAYMDRHREALPFTPQHRLEVRNAIRLLVWSKRISTTDRTRAFREIEEDLDTELFLIHSSIDYTETCRRAEKIGATHNENIGCRSSDLFHVAVALQLGFKQFLTFDHKQLEIARAIGLKVDF